MFKKVKELLENGSISKEVADLLDGEIQTELTSLRGESAEWRTKFKELQTTFNDVSSSKKSLEEQVTGIDEKIKKAKEDGKKELVTELERERVEKNELVDKFNKLETTNKTLKIDNSLSKALGTYDLIDNDLVSLALKQNLTIKDDVVGFSDGKSLDDGIKSFFETKTHLLKPTGNAGSGTEDNNSGYAKDSLTVKKLALLNN